MEEEELIKKWERYGLLSGLKNTRNCSLAFEQAEVLFETSLTNNNETNEKKSLMVVLPSLRRIFNNYEEDISVEIIHKVTENVVKTLPKLYNQMKYDFDKGRRDGSALDYEARFVAEYSMRKEKELLNALLNERI